MQQSVSTLLYIYIIQTKQLLLIKINETWKGFQPTNLWIHLHELTLRGTQAPTHQDTSLDDDDLGISPAAPAVICASHGAGTELDARTKNYRHLSCAGQIWDRHVQKESIISRKRSETTKGRWPWKSCQSLVWMHLNCEVFFFQRMYWCQITMWK